MKLKICGMKSNTLEVAQLQPDYLGFIFWEPSKRYFNNTMPEINSNIEKVGVFVNETINEVVGKVKKYGLKGVQLHGTESPEYCKNLTAVFKDIETQVAVIKVFSVNDDFDFKTLEPYEKVCDYYLFDTKGKLPGGNGYTFDWKLLKDYPATKPYFLSGGIGLNEMDAIKEFMQRPEAKYCYALDINSRFEIEPGLKDIEKLKTFIKTLSITDY